MSKGLIVFIVIACIGLAFAKILFMKVSADHARKVSDKIVEEFKAVDKDLEQTHTKIDSAGKILFDSMNNKLK